MVLTLFFPIFPFDAPENIKNLWFSVFKEIKRENWEEKGQQGILQLTCKTYSFSAFLRTIS